jgi:3-oxoacyl-[acyl-carrier protein] reductase
VSAPDPSAAARRVAIVTGGAGAIGRAYCLGLARAGYSVVVADRRPGTEVVDAIAAEGGSAIEIEVDVSDRGSTAEMARRTLDEFGRIDVLINNAAHFSSIVKRPFEEIDDAEWDLAFAVNVRGAWLCTCAVVPTMRAQGAGRIINTSSMTFRGGAIPGFAHYVSTKAAIVGLTRSLARELGVDGIAVNTISPDYIAHEGEMFDRQPEMGARLTAQRSFPREQTPEDLVGTVLFLAGENSGFITGQDIWVNGGRLFS